MILFIRLVQQRPLLHRMTTRTVVIGDAPGSQLFPALCARWTARFEF